MFQDNKYSRWYFSIIDRAKNANRKKTKDTYFESHHVIPKSIILNSNTVLLTAREHYICHLLLPKMMINQAHKAKMFYALWRILIRTGKGKVVVPSIIYEKTRCEQAQLSSKRLTGVSKDYPVWNKGKPWSDEMKKKIGEARSKVSTGPRPNLRELQLAKKGIPQEIVKCPHCMKSGGISIMKRWHFDKCRDV